MALIISVFLNCLYESTIISLAGCTFSCLLFFYYFVRIMFCKGRATENSIVCNFQIFKFTASFKNEDILKNISFSEQKTEEINNGLFSNYNEILFDHSWKNGQTDRPTDG